MKNIIKTAIKSLLLIGIILLLSLLFAGILLVVKIYFYMPPIPENILKWSEIVATILLLASTPVTAIALIKSNLLKYLKDNNIINTNDGTLKLLAVSILPIAMFIYYLSGVANYEETYKYLLAGCFIIFIFVLYLHIPQEIKKYSIYLIFLCCAILSYFIMPFGTTKALLIGICLIILLNLLNVIATVLLWSLKEFNK